MSDGATSQSFFEELSVFTTSHNVSEETLPLLPSVQETLAQWTSNSRYHATYFTPILRGIPRLFLATDPSISKIKKPFMDREVLLRHWLHRPLLTLYASSTPSLSLHLSLLTWVISDGWGDLFTQLEAAHLIHAHFPHFKLTLFTLIHQERTPPCCEHPFEQVLISYSGKLNGPISHSPFSREQLLILSRSDLLIEMPTAFPRIDELLASLTPTPSYLRLGENSMIDSVLYHPTTPAWSMGLHFLEKGIFIKTLPLIENDLPLRDQNLRHLLLSPFEDVANYRKHRRFQLAYTKSYRGLYLYLVAVLSSLADDPRDLDICLFQAPLLAQVLHRQFQDPLSLEFPLFQQWNIGEFHLYISPHFTHVSISSSGKRVRFIHCDQIAHDDQLLLTSFTDHLIGATGDQSVLEAIATGCPFFYDPPSFKRAFLIDLCHIAEKKLSAFPSLGQFLRLCLKDPTLSLEDDQGGWVSENCVAATHDFLSLEEDNDLAIGQALGKLLKHPDLPLAFQALQHYLANHYSMTPILKGLITRTALGKQYPFLLEQEENELKKLLQGTQTLDETLTLIARHIDEKM
jgi:hypothetical protein